MPKSSKVTPRISMLPGEAAIETLRADGTLRTGAVSRMESGPGDALARFQADARVTTLFSGEVCRVWARHGDADPTLVEEWESEVCGARG